MYLCQFKFLECVEMAERFMGVRNTWLLYLTSTQAKWSYFELSWVELGLRLGFDNIRAPRVCVAKQLFSELVVEGGGGGGGGHH